MAFDGAGRLPQGAVAVAQVAQRDALAAQESNEQLAVLSEHEFVARAASDELWARLDGDDPIANLKLV